MQGGVIREVHTLGRTHALESRRLRQTVNLEIRALEQEGEGPILDPLVVLARVRSKVDLYLL